MISYTYILVTSHLATDRLLDNQWNLVIILYHALTYPQIIPKPRVKQFLSQVNYYLLFPVKYPTIDTDCSRPHGTMI